MLTWDIMLSRRRTFETFWAEFGMDCTYWRIKPLLLDGATLQLQRIFGETENKKVQVHLANVSKDPECDEAG